MPQSDIIANVAVEIIASPAAIWDALINPEKIALYMFGARVTSDWQEGSVITWRGEWKGQPYEDKGKILQVIPERALQYTHYSPMTGAPDMPENYHTVTIALAPGDEATTKLTLTQDGIKTEAERLQSEQTWGAMLDGLRQVAEDGKLSSSQKLERD